MDKEKEITAFNKLEKDILEALNNAVVYSEANQDIIKLLDDTKLRDLPNSSYAHLIVQAYCKGQDRL